MNEIDKILFPSRSLILWLEYFERKCFRWKFKKQIKHILKENTDSGTVDGESYNSNLIQGKECPRRNNFFSF